MRKNKLILFLIVFASLFLIKSCQPNESELEKIRKRNYRSVIDYLGRRYSIYIHENKSRTIEITDIDSSQISIFLDSSENIEQISMTNSDGHLHYGTQYDQGVPKNDLTPSCWLNKDTFNIGDSATLNISLLNRLYRNISAKVYYPLDSSAYDSRPYPEIFGVSDDRNADSVAANHLIYKFKVVSSQKNLAVIRVFCYETGDEKCLKYQKKVTDIKINIKK